ncbi:hypothetical protein BCR36DRAFT_408252 [Piromyces finnis]|uniref:Uncharacterized protein n=1 Tax=Piromyces finnis TaxID=1754191 RepID=A0A1Y1VLR4_9FUNG|nr:hypothetical protein BCR36DRAFT_408252 [Piromyces finnis]|eukprot:ORX59875.1 hypothetical protein BCR36DRAFT_408252 [Piromyces finnis]
MRSSFDIVVLFFCLMDIGLGIYQLINAVSLTSSKKIKNTYSHYFTEYNASLLKIIITLTIMCLSVAVINLIALVIKNKSILKKHLKIYRVRKFNNSLFMFRIEKAAVEKMIIQHKEDKVRMEKNSNSIAITLLWILLIYLRFIMIGIIIFFAKLNYNNANDMNQIAIFEHLSSYNYRNVINVSNKK